MGSGIDASALPSDKFIKYIVLSAICTCAYSACFGPVPVAVIAAASASAFFASIASAKFCLVIWSTVAVITFCNISSISFSVYLFNAVSSCLNFNLNLVNFCSSDSTTGTCTTGTGTCTTGTTAVSSSTLSYKYSVP